MSKQDSRWIDRNQQYLATALAEVRGWLDQRPDSSVAAAAMTPAAGLDPPPAIEILSNAFGLSRFERSILLLCAGMELDSTLASVCAKAQGETSRPYPTFSLALAMFPEAHWSALTPAAPLRRWRLIELGGGASPTLSPLRIDERILHYLTGIHYLDDRLAAILDPVSSTQDLVSSHQDVANRIVAVLDRAAQTDVMPVVQLWGGEEPARRMIAGFASAHLNVRLLAVGAELIPTAAADLDGLLRLWQRECVLSPAAIYVDADSAHLADGGAALQRFLERCGSILILSSRDRWKPLRRPVASIEVRKATTDEQRGVWQALLKGTPLAVDGHVHRLVSQFNLNVPAIRAAVRDAMGSAAASGDLATSVWEAGRAQARPRLEDVAQRIESGASWDDLVLPEGEKRQLREIASHAALRGIVYDQWGFAAKGTRGLGISALFSGASGTGKTMAAEVLANFLRLDLYRIDLSSVVSKYIGETEKNLRRVFDAADDGGAILFFDEADALFGKRSEVKDSHDRYANIEINYLLQRMESYRGLAVLATNMKSALDPAFLRRIRFVINFPFPDEAHRRAIWERAFPEGVPVEGLDAARLARPHLAGGNIRNIALNAAFLAADDGTAVRMYHLARATRGEFAKLERPLNEEEIGGWR